MFENFLHHIIFIYLFFTHTKDYTELVEPKKRKNLVCNNLANIQANVGQTNCDWGAVQKSICDSNTSTQKPLILFE